MEMSGISFHRLPTNAELYKKNNSAVGGWLSNLFVYFFIPRNIFSGVCSDAGDCVHTVATHRHRHLNQFRLKLMLYGACYDIKGAELECS